jgi:hypothetical protein
VQLGRSYKEERIIGLVLGSKVLRICRRLRMSRKVRGVADADVSLLCILGDRHPKEFTLSKSAKLIASST